VRSTPERASIRRSEVRGPEKYGCVCSTCGRYVEGIRGSFALECVGVRCPTTDGQDIVGKNTALKRDGSGFEFHGIIEFTSCANGGLRKRAGQVEREAEARQVDCGANERCRLEVERA
jgi:hypothetical protein